MKTRKIFSLACVAGLFGLLLVLPSLAELRFDGSTAGSCVLTNLTTNSISGPVINCEPYTAINVGIVLSGPASTNQYTTNLFTLSFAESINGTDYGSPARWVFPMTNTLVLVTNLDVSTVKTLKLVSYTSTAISNATATVWWAGKATK